jgi:hypothetical protein
VEEVVGRPADLAAPQDPGMSRSHLGFKDDGSEGAGPFYIKRESKGRSRWFCRRVDMSLHKLAETDRS